MFLRAIASVALDNFGLTQGTSSFASNWRNGFDQWVKLSYVVAVCAR